MAGRAGQAARAGHAARAGRAVATSEAVDGAGLLGAIDTDDPEAVAEAAGLVYVHDTAPGMSRRRAGRSFRYLRPDGSPVTDPT